MSKRITFSKLAKKVEEKKSKKAEESKNVSSNVKSTPPTKGIVIREKCKRDDVPITSPQKASYKGKEAMSVPEHKKAKSKSMPSELETVLARPASPGEGTSTNPMATLGPKVTILRSAALTKKILEAHITHFDKNEVDKLELDWMVSKFFHIFGQVIC